jgi:4-alpha-glucanotransferase
MAAAAVLGMRVLWFERQGDRFLSPREWDGNSMAMTTTHDLPTVAGWWEGRDIDWRARLGILGENVREEDERANRAREKEQLARVFRENQLLPEGQEINAQTAVDGAIALVGCTPSPLAIVPLEDFLGLEEAPNLPGTIGEHPNWRRRLGPLAGETFGIEPPCRRAGILQGET